MEAPGARRAVLLALLSGTASSSLAGLAHAAALAPPLSPNLASRLNRSLPVPLFNFSVRISRCLPACTQDALVLYPSTCSDARPPSRLPLPIWGWGAHAQPEPVKFPRRTLDQRFAVLLMRSAYDAVDKLDFIPMQKFQVCWPGMHAHKGRFAWRVHVRSIPYAHDCLGLSGGHLDKLQLREVTPPARQTRTCQ
jgi:hypothetical protein